MACPAPDLGDNGIDESNDPALYDEPVVPTSPFPDALKDGATTNRKSKGEAAI